MRAKVCYSDGFRRSVAVTRVWGKILFKLVGYAVERLCISGLFMLDRNVRPGRGVFCIQLKPAFETWPGVRENGFGRALRLAYAAIDAFIGADHEHVFALVKAVNGAHFDAIHIFASDAIVGDDEGHIAGSGGHG